MALLPRLKTRVSEPNDFMTKIDKAELEKLTAKQQDVLKALAIHPSLEPTGQNFVSVSGAPVSTVNQTIKSLLNKDMVYKVKQADEALPQLKQNQLRVLDPLLSFALKKYS